MLIDFLDSVDSVTLFLGGDVVDGWQLKKRAYWPTAHNNIVSRLMKRTRRGTRVSYIPGNHDEMFCQFTGMYFGGVEIRHKMIHTTADGRKFLVLHGDEFDAVTLARLRWGGCLYRADGAQSPAQSGAALVCSLLLGALQNGQAQGEKRARLHLPLRGNCGA